MAKKKIFISCWYTEGCVHWGGRSGYRSSEKRIFDRYDFRLLWCLSVSSPSCSAPDSTSWDQFTSSLLLLLRSSRPISQCQFVALYGFQPPSVPSVDVSPSPPTVRWKPQALPSCALTSSHATGRCPLQLPSKPHQLSWKEKNKTLYLPFTSLSSFWVSASGSVNPSSHDTGIENRFFEGVEGQGKNPKYSLTDLDNEYFRTVGEIIAVSLAQGGPAPAFLKEWCYGFICTGDMDLCSLSKQDVTDQESSLLITKVGIW
ncbi:uncharacterized protein LOC111947509 [Oryzias latipes]|uniref:uncharacterized protein LOC111947509 n=1 Tax=Oryzias latipes TaxID=8090 RepID=UPI000CE1644F|nr:uncharacterized protein LOC111947509 [Oryzias latipes]